MLLVLLFTSSGCTSITEPIFAPNTAVKPDIKTTTVPIVETALITPTVSPTPTLPTLSPTPATIPTLTDAEVTRFLQRFTTREPGCVLPCLGGITPGFTHWKVINPFILTKGGKEYQPNSISEAQAIFPGFPENQSIGAGFFFTPKNDVVDSFTVEIQEYGNPTTAFQSMVEIYSPEKIVREHGRPSKVLLSSIDYTQYAPGNLNQVGYILWLFYEQQGFAIRYHGSTPTYHPETYHICPKIGENGNIGHIYFDLRSEQSRNLLGRGDDIIESNYRRIRSFQDVTGKTLDDFTQIFSQSTQPACFDMPRIVWRR